jgi:hypothetical protein
VSAAITSVAGAADVPDLEAMVGEYLDGVAPHFRARVGRERAVAEAREMGAGRASFSTPASG